MKNVVTLDEIREVEMRSQNVFDDYFTLLTEDVPEFFQQKEPQVLQACPACGCEHFTDQFEKLSFVYRTCDDCGSMFVKQRASDAALSEYRIKSASHEYFVNNYLKNLESSGRQLLTPRINWILDSIVEYNAPKQSYLDLQSKYPSLLERIAEEKFFEEHYFARPLFDPQQWQFGDFTQKGAFKSNTNASMSVITAFEYLDTMFNPREFIQEANRILMEGGLLFLTTRCISGFDMQVLWENSKSILPPHHVSIFSVEGLIQLFESAGFVIQELSTPGQLDLDIVANALKENPQLKVPQFIKYLIHQRDPEAHQSFKEFLQKHRLSSHTRIVVQKKHS